jgi:Ca-activated chloride channel homolog
MKLFHHNIRILIIGLLLVAPVALFGQQERKYIRKGNRLYDKGKYPGSEIQYRRAQGIDKPVPDANFNVGDALYKQKKYSEAADQFEQSLNAYKTPAQAAEAYYNKGNALLKDQKYKESIESYINSLKYSPDNTEAKYNLAYAQRMLKKQQEQQQKQDQKNKDDKQKQDQQKKDQNKDQDKNKQDQNKDQDKNKQDQNKDQDKNKQDQNQQNGSGQQPGMSREDAKRLLDALSANEKDVQAKVNKDKKGKGYVRVTKNW